MGVTSTLTAAGTEVRSHPFVTVIGALTVACAAVGTVSLLDSRSRTSGSSPSCAHSSRRSETLEPESWRQASRNDGDSNATSTTARSSASSRSLHLRMAQESLHDDPPAVEALLEGVGEDLKQALEELRELARGLHPAVLTDRGLAPALQSLANRPPFPVQIGGVPSLRLGRAVEAAVYYGVAESLTNAAKYASASGARVQLSTTAGTIAVEIRDDGNGGADMRRGSGIRGLADRVEALGGQLEIRSPAGHGTLVRAELPLARAQ